MENEKAVKKYEEILRKYIGEFSGFNNKQIARLICEREATVHVKPDHMRKVVALARKMFGDDSPYFVKGVSTLRDNNGNVVMEWVKTDIDKERRHEMLQIALEEMKRDIKPYKPKKLVNIDRSEHLCNQYTITDYHLGMMAVATETGNEWNLELAETLLIDWFERAIKQSPYAKQCVFAQIGDFLHFDGLEALTPASKHVLDASTRYPMLVRVVIRVLRKIVEMLLVKYENVHIVMAEGNHDLASSVWLREVFSMFYEKENRITVDTNMNPYYHFQWGDVCLFYHHSHLKSARNGLDAVFVANFKEHFGKSTHVFGHTGHFHHQTVMETNLMIIEQHPTLSAKDAYASRGGYNSQRNAKVITYHSKFGEVGRLTINPDMLK